MNVNIVQQPNDGKKYPVTIEINGTQFEFMSTQAVKTAITEMVLSGDMENATALARWLEEYANTATDNVPVIREIVLDRVVAGKFTFTLEFLDDGTVHVLKASRSLSEKDTPLYSAVALPAQ